MHERMRYSMVEKTWWQWVIQVIVPVILFISYGIVNEEEFKSKHPIANSILWIGVYVVFNVYVDLVRNGIL